MNYAIAPDNPDLIEKLAKAAYLSMRADMEAARREVGDRQTFYYLTWEFLPPEHRKRFCYRVREALRVWRLHGSISGELQFLDDF